MRGLFHAWGGLLGSAVSDSIQSVVCSDNAKSKRYAAYEMLFFS